MLLDKNSLAGYSVKNDRRSVTLPGGEMALIRALSVRGSEAFQAALAVDQAKAQRVLIAHSLCDQSGVLVLDPEHDLPLLDNLPSAAGLALQKAIIEHNGLNPEAADAAGEQSAATHG
jgi:hypothetical protein